MTIRLPKTLLATALAFALAAPVAPALAGAPSRTRVAQAERQRARPAARPAAAKPTSQKVRSTTKQPEPKLKRIEFREGDDVEGGTHGPGGDVVGGRTDLTHTNLIRVRSDFLREIFKSAEDL